MLGSSAFAAADATGFDAGVAFYGSLIDKNERRFEELDRAGA